MSIFPRAPSAELSRGVHIDPPAYDACARDLVIVLWPFLVPWFSVGSCIYFTDASNVDDHVYDGTTLLGAALL